MGKISPVQKDSVVVNRKEFKKASILLLLLSLILGSSVAIWGTDRHAQAADTTIDAAELKSISRLHVSIRDDRNQPYTLYLFANDEKRLKNLNDEEVYSGTYRTALVKSGQTIGQIQSVNLNDYTFNAARNESFRLPGDGKSRPDLLFLAESGSYGFDSIRAFVIRNGVLHPLDFAAETGAGLGQESYTSGKNAVRGLSDNRIQTRMDAGVEGQYYFGTYRLDLENLKLKHIEDLYRTSESWPTTQGAHAFLKNVKKSALQQKSRGVTQMAAALPPDTFIWPHQLEEWLGVPTRIRSDADGRNHTLEYRWHDVTVSFLRKEENTPIDAFTIR